MPSARDELPPAATGASQPSTPLGIPRLLTSEEAAGVLAICTKTLLTLTRKGEVPGLRVGTQWRYELADLREWIQQRKTHNAASRSV